VQGEICLTPIQTKTENTDRILINDAPVANCMRDEFKKRQVGVGCSQSDQKFAGLSNM
jgi:hypothetical protein